MTGTDKRTPQPQAPEEPPLAWQVFFATGPELWIPGLIAVVSVTVFGVPDGFRLALFFAALIVVLMLGSVVAVYLFGRSFKRGKSASGRPEKRRS